MVFEKQVENSNGRKHGLFSKLCNPHASFISPSEGVTASQRCTGPESGSATRTLPELENSPLTGDKLKVGKPVSPQMLRNLTGHIPKAPGPARALQQGPSASHSRFQFLLLLTQCTWDTDPTTCVMDKCTKASHLREPVAWGAGKAVERKTKGLQTLLTGKRW